MAAEDSETRQLHDCVAPKRRNALDPSRNEEQVQGGECENEERCSPGEHRVRSNRKRGRSESDQRRTRPRYKTPPPVRRTLDLTCTEDLGDDEGVRNPRAKVRHYLGSPGGGNFVRCCYHERNPLAEERGSNACGSERRRLEVYGRDIRQIDVVGLVAGNEGGSRKRGEVAADNESKVNEKGLGRPEVCASSFMVDAADSEAWLKDMGSLFECSGAAIKMAAGYIKDVEANVENDQGKGVCKLGGFWISYTALWCLSLFLASQVQDNHLTSLADLQEMLLVVGEKWEIKSLGQMAVEFLNAVDWKLYALQLNGDI